MPAGRFGRKAAAPRRVPNGSHCAHRGFVPWRRVRRRVVEFRRFPVTTSRSYADFFVPESEVVLSARARAADLGAAPTGSGTAAALTFLAAAVGARSVVEIGTGTGVSGLHLFAGMAPDGILTTIDIEAEYQRAAKKAFIEAGIAPTRTRLINGRALDVLPRL